jgi:hypothetical protein
VPEEGIDPPFLVIPVLDPVTAVAIQEIEVMGVEGVEVEIEVEVVEVEVMVVEEEVGVVVAVEVVVVVVAVMVVDMVEVVVVVVVEEEEVVVVVVVVVVAPTRTVLVTGTTFVWPRSSGMLGDSGPACWDQITKFPMKTR